VSVTSRTVIQDIHLDLNLGAQSPCMMLFSVGYTCGTRQDVVVLSETHDAAQTPSRPLGTGMLQSRKEGWLRNDVLIYGD